LISHILFFHRLSAVEHYSQDYSRTKKYNGALASVFANNIAPISAAGFAMG